MELEVVSHSGVIFEQWYQCQTFWVMYYIEVKKIFSQYGRHADAEFYVDFKNINRLL
jgi:hypothetical protein